MTTEQQQEQTEAAGGASAVDRRVRLDIAPEHTKRGSVDHNCDGPLHPEIVAAYDYVDSVLDTSDFKNSYAWYGWALREAFLAGISYARIATAIEPTEYERDAARYRWLRDNKNTYPLFFIAQRAPNNVVVQFTGELADMNIDEMMRPNAAVRDCPPNEQEE